MNLDELLSLNQLLRLHSSSFHVHFFSLLFRFCLSALMSVIYARFIQFISLHRWIKSVQFKRTRSVMGLFGNENTYNYVHFKTQIVLYRFKAVVSGSFNKVLVSAIQKKKMSEGRKIWEKRGSQGLTMLGTMRSFIQFHHSLSLLWSNMEILFPECTQPTESFPFYYNPQGRKNQQLTFPIAHSNSNDIDRAEILMVSVQSAMKQ